MKIKLLGQGNDGQKHYNVGSVYEQKNEWAIRMLATKNAQPLDDEAKTMLAKIQKELGE